MAEFHGVKSRWEIKYEWSGGIAISRFMQGLKEGKILGVKCPQCKRILVPPRIFCERCFIELTEWVELSPRGKINTFSIAYIDTNALPVSTPQINAVIDLDDARGVIGIFHIIGEAKPEEIYVGMPVEAVFRPAEERTGSILDIKYFRPVKEGKPNE